MSWVEHAAQRALIRFDADVADPFTRANALTRLYGPARRLTTTLSASTCTTSLPANDQLRVQAANSQPSAQPPSQKTVNAVPSSPGLPEMRSETIVMPAAVQPPNQNSRKSRSGHSRLAGITIRVPVAERCKRERPRASGSSCTCQFTHAGYPAAHTRRDVMQADRAAYDSASPGGGALVEANVDVRTPVPQQDSSGPAEGGRAARRRVTF